MYYITCNSKKYSKIIHIKSKYVIDIWVAINLKILIMLTWGEGGVSNFDYAC